MQKDNEVKHRLLVNLYGYGNKGDALTVLKISGELAIVSNGVKKFSIERKYLSLCQQCQQQEVQTS